MTEWGKLIRFLHHRRRNRQNLVWRAIGTIYLEETERQFPVEKVSALPVFACLTSMTALSGLETVKMEYTR